MYFLKIMFKFLKFHANGNDFIFLFKKINNLKLNKLLNTKTGVICDQLFIIDQISYKNNYVKIIIYNRDNTKALNCGNGIRTLSNFFLKKKKKNEIIKIIINNNYVFSWKNINNSIYTAYNIPKNIKTIMLKIKLCYLKIGYINLYNYHVIVFVKNIKSFNIIYIKKKIQELFNFSINIEFVQILNKSSLYIRIIEKGVGETYSCGSGIICSTYYLYSISLISKNIIANTLGGQCFITQYNNLIIIYGKTTFCFFGYL